MRFLLACLLSIGLTHAQQAQNPSPMVEHTRAHPRLKEQTPPGRREKLALGTLFLPAGMKPANGADCPLLLSRRNLAARSGGVSKQGGGGHGAGRFRLRHYARLFDDPARFPALLKEAEDAKPACTSAASCWAAGAPGAARSGRF